MRLLKLLKLERISARLYPNPVVGDVRNDSRYLTTFGSTRSETIVPILKLGTQRVLGLIDVESDRLEAFAEPDHPWFEQCAALLSDTWKDLK